MKKQLRLITIGFLLLGCTTLTAQQFQREIDSLENMLVVEHTPERQVDLINGIAYAYRRIDPDSIFKYAQQAISLALRQDYDQGLATAYKNMGIAHYKSGAPTDTITSTYERAIEYAEKVEDYYTIAACYNNIALVSLNELSYHQAIRNLLNGVAIFDEKIQEDNFLKALMLGNLGTAYHKQGDNLRGIAYYERALAVAERLGNKVIPSIYVDELARAKMEEGLFQEAQDDIIRLLPLHDELGDYESKAESLLTLSEVKMAIGLFGEAKEHAQEAFMIAEEKGFKRTQALALLHQSAASFRAGNTEEAIRFGELARDAAREGKSIVLEADATELLAQQYAQNGHYEEAYQSIQTALELFRSNTDEESNRLAEELEAKYQNRDRQAQIDRLNQEKTTQRQRIRNLWFAAAVFLMLLIILIWISIQKTRTADQLEEKHNALQKAEQKLNEKNSELERYIESNLQLENFAHLASHDLREPMRTIVSFSQLLGKSASDKLNEKEREYLHFVQNGTHRIEGLVKDLLEYSTVSHSPLILEAVEVPDLIREVQEDLQHLIDQKDAVVHCQSLPGQIIADSSRLYQLFQNLLSNAIRYSRPGHPPNITIRANEQQEYWQFAITDNGVGIDPQFHQQIFLLFKSLENKSVSGGSGIGLATCKKVVEDHNGQIWLESELGTGSTFFFSIAKNLAA